MAEAGRQKLINLGTSGQPRKLLSHSRTVKIDKVSYRLTHVERKSLGIKDTHNHVLVQMIIITLHAWVFSFADDV